MKEKEEIKKGVVIKDKVIYNGDLYTRTDNNVIEAPKSVIDRLAAKGKVKPIESQPAKQITEKNNNNAGKSAQSSEKKTDAKPISIWPFNKENSGQEDSGQEKQENPDPDNNGNPDSLKISFNPDEVIKQS